MLVGRFYRPNKSQPLALQPRKTNRSFMGGSGYAHAQGYTTKSVGVASRTSTCQVVSGRFSYSGLARAAMKRALSSSDEASTSEAKKRKVTYATYQKCKSELDRDCQTVSWLDCKSKVVAGKRIVSKLRCSMCAKFKAKIGSRRNFSDRWIVGADSVRTSNIRDHARADQHTHAMNLGSTVLDGPRAERLSVTHNHSRNLCTYTGRPGGLPGLALALALALALD